MKNSDKKNNVSVYEFDDETLDSIFSANPSTSDLRRHIHKYQNELLVNYYDMSYIASIADNSFVLCTPIKSYTSSGIFPEKRKNQYEKDVVFVKEHNKKAKKVHSKLEKHVDLKSKLFNQIRQIYPDFCLKVDSKIDSNQFELYKKARMNLRFAICQDMPYSADTPSEEVLNRSRDKLSQVIDSKAFLDACIIEENFVLSEFNEFSNKLANLSPEERNAFLKQKVSLSDSKHVSMQELLKKFKSEISANLSRHLETLKLYDKISSAKEIKLTLKSENRNDESGDR